MAWEWLAPAAAVAGALVGGSTTWLVGRGARKHAETLADKNHAHAGRMAHQERQQKRFADAYTELLTFAERAGHWAARVTGPIKFEIGPPREQPEPPSDADRIRVRALAQAYGSPAVKKLFWQYLEAVDAIAVQVRVLTIMATANVQADAHDYLDAEGQLNDELRPAEVAKRTELAEQIAAELGAYGPS